MTTHDPAQHDRRLSRDALRHFTNREKAIEMLESYLNAPTDEKMKVLVFYGLGGIGKTALQLKLCDQLRNDDPSIPFASFNMEKIGNKTGAYREVLLNLRFDFERDFGIKFPRFDLCWAVIVAHEGGNPEPLVRVNPALQDTFDFAACLLEAPVSGLTGLVDKLIRRYPTFEKRIRHVFNTEDVIRLRNMAMRDDSALPGELISSFAFDLKEGLPVREGKACRGILFMDSYETLWVAREGGASAQARLLDEWVRDLIFYCLHPSVGVLPVICGRDRLQWAEDNPQWQGELDQQLLGGLSAHDAQLFLSRCGIGPAPDESNITPLQEAIIKCCREQQQEHSSDEFACHPFYMALCAEIVQNTRDDQGNDPPPSMFSNIPSAAVANELATRFFKSLNSRAMELWVSELSLTPRFDEEAALALDDERKHHNGRAGWDRLRGFSFMDSQDDGFYRFHKIMKDALRNKLRENDQQVIHEWFCNYWENRGENALSWYHKWLVDPENILLSWNKIHENAIKHLHIDKARELLSYWDETVLDEYVHERVGDEIWANTHMSIGYALWKTPQLTRSHELVTAIEHYNETLKVYTETEFPMECAMFQNNLGAVYSDLPTGDHGKNLENAIQCYKAALRVHTKIEFPMHLAMTHNNLGIAYSKLPTGNRGKNLENAIQCFKAALRIQTETEFPMHWALTHDNLGSAYSNLPIGDRGENLENAIQCYKAALRVHTEIELPNEWAMTQNNLGATYSDLPTGDREENLENAIQCYKAALRVHT
ncbi:MAG: Tetratricopeptide (TPR) repeat, partial [Candidatus Methanocomedens sp.]